MITFAIAVNAQPNAVEKYSDQLFQGFPFINFIFLNVLLILIFKYRSKFPNRYQKEAILANSNNEDIKKLENSSLEEFGEHFSRVVIHVDNSHGIYNVQNIRMSIKDLISEIGEYLGMFLGMSILSAFEFVDLLVSIVSVYEKSIVNIMGNVAKITYRFFGFFTNKKF